VLVGETIVGGDTVVLGETLVGGDTVVLGETLVVGETVVLGVPVGLATIVITAFAEMLVSSAMLLSPTRSEAPVAASPLVCVTPSSCT
jgi:hypothetical protein